MSRHLIRPSLKHRMHRSGVRLSDLYATNGFNLPLTADTGTKWVLDADGTLVQSPVDTPAMPGCRLADGVWYPTDTNGAELYTVDRIIRTPAGSVKQYDVTYPGVMVEPAMTNKVTCRKCNPVDTSQIGTTGGVTVSLYDASASLGASSLLVGNGNVYRLTSVASGKAYNSGGETTNTNKHSLMCLARKVSGSGQCYFQLASTFVGRVEITSSDWTWYKIENLTPSSTGNVCFWELGENCVVDFIYPNLVGFSFIGSPIMLESAEDTIGTVSRPSDNISFPTPAWLMSHPNDFAIIQRVIPAANEQASKMLLSTGLDPYTAVYCTASGIISSKYDGGATYISLSHSLNKSVLNDIIYYQSSIAGMGLSARSYASGWGDWATWATETNAAGKLDAPIYDDFKIGRRSTTDHFSATFPMTRIIRIPPGLTTATQIQSWLKAEAEGS